MIHSLARFKTGELATRRERIFQFERALGFMPQIELPVTHDFTDGVYTRTMFIPAGVALVGHIHRCPCMTIIQRGVILIATERGVECFVGPHGPLSSPAGIKRAGYALADTVLTTIHANPKDERDIDRLEDMLIAKDYNDLPAPHPALIGEGHAEPAA